MSLSMYEKWNYYFIGSNNIYIEIIRDRLTKRSMVNIISNNVLFSHEGEYNNVFTKNKRIYYLDSFISNDIINMFEIKELISFKRANIIMSNTIIRTFGKSLISDSQALYVITKGNKPLLSYFYIAGSFDNFNGTFFIKLSDFNFNKVDCYISLFYHNKKVKTSGKTKFKLNKNHLTLKVSDYKNTIKITVDLVEYKIVNDLGDNINTITKKVYMDNYINIIVEDDNLTKSFNGTSYKNIIEERQYL